MPEDMVMDECVEAHSEGFPGDFQETGEVRNRGFPGCSQETAPCSSDAANCPGTDSCDLDDEDEVIHTHNHDHSDAGLTCLPSLWKQEAVFAKRIDKMCRALFPAMFIIFNLIYWLYYQVYT